jgi:hypothetical protein
MPQCADVAAERQLPASRLLVLLLLAAGAATAMLPGGFRPLDTRAQVLLGAVSLALLALAALRLISGVADAAGGLARWRLGPWYLLWASLTLGVASITWLGPQSGSATRIALPSVLVAMTLVGVSIAVWTAGYLLGPPRALRNGARQALALAFRGTGTTVRGGAVPWALYGVGSAARLVSVLSTGRLGYVGDPSTLVSHAGPFTHALDMLSTLTIFAIASAAYLAFRTGRTGSKITLWTLVAIEIVVGALAGGKESFVLSILAVLIPYGATRGRIGLRVILAGGLLFLWVAVPFNGAYRQVVRGQESTLTPSAAIAAAPDVFSEVADPTTLGTTLVDSATTILYRLREVDNVAIVTQLTPSVIPYRSPLEFAQAPLIGVVPRALWPDKPVLATGYQFGQEYYGLSSDMYTSSAITPLGDLYRHGGWPTVVAGILLLGMGCRLFDALFQPERDPRAMCFLLVFLPIIVKSEVDVYGLIVSVPSALLTAVVGARLICRGATSS